VRFLPKLFENNRAWAAECVARDPAFFTRLCGLQTPEYLWIGCSDSRVPANQIVGLAPGELFVHRNVANVVAADDANLLSVLQYAVEVLRVSHVIVCGHYGCGGVLAALGEPLAQEPLERWIRHIRAVREANRAELDAFADPAARWRRLCELNVAAQVRALGVSPIVTGAWERGWPLVVHGWIYDLRDGLLHDQGLSVAGPA
jgi:carbonic anhydrase